ncbi:BtaA family protein [Aliifodinibius sp. S!AR15-10]|uniref:DUF3419 family protein n=1 Tax=Aliifodinibius sp. S!AR15-10 TaxID=2950437 RepID=UPI002858BACF|nr:BtaA family protein [Aliifodinibius sp. S!AR15-10]MDR8390945.1 BtaA family protein [Aliifodinibius sp. S!AR15-10]
MSAIKQLVQNIQNRFFDSIVTNHLVYNTCWEDPRIDRKLLNINSDSKIVMLTSAGCNALDYLLDDPETVHAVDANPNQNALLELKQALFEHGSHGLLFDFLGRGSHSAARLTYEQYLKSHISPEARKFWDKHINYFSGSSSQPSFYFRGTSGKIALMMHRHIKRKGLYTKALNLLDSSSLKEQEYYYQEIEPELWNGFSRWLLKRNSTMALLGVPETQRNLIEEQWDGGLFQFIRDSMKHVFTELPIRDNYFWRVYITGSYTPTCCPNYLKPPNFNKLRTRSERIHPHTTTLSNFLQTHPDSYSHFVLLDHQDWMAHANPSDLEEEWRLILENAAPRARILFRSACRNVDFLPPFIQERVKFNTDLTNRLHHEDRVGTYGSTHLGIVEP